MENKTKAEILQKKLNNAIPVFIIECLLFFILAFIKKIVNIPEIKILVISLGICVAVSVAYICYMYYNINKEKRIEKYKEQETKRKELRGEKQS